MLSTIFSIDRIREELKNNEDKIFTSDISSFENAQNIASLATEITGNTYLAADNGPNIRCYGIIKAPQIGDSVSCGFNGDFYPVGKITHISANFKKIVTCTKNTFYRYKQTPLWKDGSFVMVKGTIDERNPHF